MSTTTSTTTNDTDTFQEGPATYNKTIVVVPPDTMLTFFQKHPAWALSMYAFPFLAIVFATRNLGISRGLAIVAAVATATLLIIGLARDLPAATNPVIASMPVLVFAAHAGQRFLFSNRK